jgi:ornithine cyclodeaminase/alanine dehydrogenase
VVKEGCRVTLLLSDADIRAVLGWRPAVAALRAAYATAGDSAANHGAANHGAAGHGAAGHEARYPGRSIARGDGSWLRVLPGVPGDGGLMGAKIIAAAPGAGRVSYLIALFDQATTQLVALLDGNTVTGYRTAATSALAADLLTVPGPLTVSVLGSGFEAGKHLRAIAAIRDITAARVYSPRAASRERFARDLADLGVPVAPAPSAQEAVAGAALVICAARSHDESPVLLGRWLAPGVTVVSVGSTVPEQREVDVATIARADVIIADVVEEVLSDTGDLIAARAAGTDLAGRVASLAGLVSGTCAGRADAGQIVLYKSVGSAVQDLAVAAMCVRAAADGGLGTRAAVPVEVVVKQRS